QEILGPREEVGEIAASTARDQNLAPDFAVVLQNQNTTSAFAGFDGAHQACGAGADHNHIPRGRRHCFILSEARQQSPPASLGLISLTREASAAMSRKVLIVTGDGGDSYEALYARHRFLESRWEPVVAAPSRRRLHMVMHDFEPGWDTYVERPGHCLEAD